MICVRRRRLICGTAYVLSLSACASFSSVTRTYHKDFADSVRPLVQRYPRPPLRFERNIGQIAAPVQAVARGRGYTVHLADGDAIFAFHPHDGSSNELAAGMRIQLNGANRPVSAAFIDQLPGLSNYFIGIDPSRWRTHVPSYAAVRYQQIYAGIDLVYYSRAGELENDFIVAPGADPAVIALTFAGADSIHVLADGGLVVRAGIAALTLGPPDIYQTGGEGGRRSVDGGYRVDGTTVRFEVASFDRSAALVIDPVLRYSTYVGDDRNEEGIAIDRDSANNLYMLGRVITVLPGHIYTRDLVITKLAADGSTVLYSTYFGGIGEDSPQDLAVGPLGEVYLTGFSSAGFPEVPGYRFNCPCDDGLFVAKLNVAGDEIVYLARMNSSVDAGPRDQGVWESGYLTLDVDSAGNAWIGGRTVEIAADAQPTFPIINAPQPLFGGMTDAVIFVLNAAGSQLLLSTFLGGAEADAASDLAVANDDAVYLTGWTRSPTFPVVNPLRGFAGFNDVFVSRLVHGQLTFSTFLGGSCHDSGQRITVDNDHFIYLTAESCSNDFPVVNQLPGVPLGGMRPLVAKLAPDGASIVFATFLGGSITDYVGPIAADDEGNTYVGGMTNSPNFPVRRSSQASLAGDFDGFVTMFGPAGELLHSTWIGGSSRDAVTDLTTGPERSVFVLGTTFSSNFPSVTPVQPLLRGSSDMFVAHVVTRLAVTSVTPIVPAGMPGRVMITGRNFTPDMRVFVAGSYATEVMVTNGTSAEATLPAAAAGVYDLVLVNPPPYNEIAVLNNGVTYAACAFNLPATEYFEATGGTRWISVQSTPPGCGWWAESHADWIRVDTPTGEVNPDQVRITVVPNTTGSGRSGTFAVQGRAVDVLQAPRSWVDFDLDRRMDLVWQHKMDGRLAVWLMDGTTQLSGELLSPVVSDTSWNVVGAGDMDRDGFVDLVWHNAADGRIAAWLMNGRSLRDGVLMSPGQVPDTRWVIRAVADFNGDDKLDLIWQHHTLGLVAIWIMDGLQLVDGHLLTTDVSRALSWQIVGSGDFNGDGYRDLVWHDLASGRVSVSLMQGTTMIGTGTVTAQTSDDIDWKVRAVGDLDGDNQPDLIWQHPLYGHLVGWLMDGLTGREGVWIGPGAVRDTNWHIVAPR